MAKESFRTRATQYHNNSAVYQTHRRGHPLWTILLLLVLLTSPNRSGAAEQADDLLQLWRRHDYQSIVRILTAYKQRAQAQHRRVSADVDILLATCLCRDPQRRQEGLRLFDRLLKDYPFTAETSRQVEVAKSAAVNPHKTPIFLTFQDTPQGMVGVRGMYSGPPVDDNSARLKNAPYITLSQTGINWFPAYGPDHVETAVFQVVHPVTGAQLAARTFPLGQSDRAIAATKKRLGASFAVTHVGHFLLASSCRGPEEERKALGNVCNDLYESIRSRFHMTSEAKFVTLILVPDADSLAKLALQLHGIRMMRYANGAQTMIYRSQGDLTIACVRTAIVASDERFPELPLYTVDVLIPVQEIAAALVDILLTDDAGYMPAWLKTGITKLYATIDLRKEYPGKGATGQPTRMMPEPAMSVNPAEAYTRDRPDITTILSADWRWFQGNRQDVIQSRRLIDTSQMFVRFLAEAQYLPNVYVAFRDRPSTDHLSPAQQDEKLLGQALRQTTSSLEIEFDTWLVSHRLLDATNLSDGGKGSEPGGISRRTDDSFGGGLGGNSGGGFGGGRAGNPFGRGF